jgi:hypothetical protein
MIPALTIAVAGMVDASQRLDRAGANTVKRAAFELPGALEKAAPGSSGANAAGPASTTQLSAPSGLPMYVPSFAEDMVAMRSAVAAYKANAAVVRTADDIARELTQEIGR